MDPLTNSLLGVVFLAVGAIATGIMYYLRGAVVAGPPGSIPPEPTTAQPAGTRSVEDAEKPAEYLAPWRRTSDEREPRMADIHSMATSGASIIEPMRTRKAVCSWDRLLIKGAQLPRLPLNEDEPVRTETVIGPAARHPLVIQTPVFVSHMSFGALSREMKIALAQGSAAAGTAICSGEGGILEEELRSTHKYIFEYVPNEYSVTDEYLQQVDAIEIKIGQSAKPGMGGHLPASKVTSEIATVRGRPPGRDIRSPSRFRDIRSPADLQQKVAWLREKSGGKPIGIKIAAGNIEADLAVAVAALPDFITLDGRPGATGAAPQSVKDATSIPTIFAICRARRFLRERQRDNISLVATGGLRISSDIAKAIALGADAVAVATAALMAAGCQQYRICHTGRCPVGITSQDPQLRKRLDVELSARRWRTSSAYRRRSSRHFAIDRARRHSPTVND